LGVSSQVNSRSCSPAFGFSPLTHALLAIPWDNIYGQTATTSNSL